MRLLALAGAMLAATTATLVAAPLLLFGGGAPGLGGCGGSGSIDGRPVPAGVEVVARQAAQSAGVDELALLALSYAGTRWGQAAMGVPDDQALAWLGDLAPDVDRSALAPGGAVATLVGRPGGVALGDWASPEPAGAEHALGFAQLLPSTWRRLAAAHLRPGGGAWDPYSPLDALTLAGHQLAGLLGAAGGDLGAAVRSLGISGFAPAYDKLRASWRDACAAGLSAGDPFGGLCRPRTVQAYGAVELIAPDGRHHGIDLACQDGAAIFSATGGVAFDVASGCVNGARDGCGAGYGNHVVVRLRGRAPGDTADHDYYVVYGHLLAAPLVSRGQAVEPGTPLGEQGDSGLSWGSHLHFEVDRDTWATLRSIDPIPFLPPWVSPMAQG